MAIFYRDKVPHASSFKPIEYAIDNAGCHVCTSHARRLGYPKVTSNGVSVVVSRYVFETVYGPIPIGMCVCHRCDNRACINPEHLFLGTKGDNHMDMEKKGRHSHGDMHGSAKLTADDVRTIRDSQFSTRVLGKLYGVSHVAIVLARNGRTWKEVVP